MSFRNLIIIVAVIILVGLAASVGCSGNSYIPSMQITAGGVPSGGADALQDNPPAEENPGDEGGTDGQESAGGGTEEVPPAAPDTLQAPGMPMAAPVKNTNLEDALAGIRDYEVTYDTSKSKKDNTPQDLANLGVYYTDTGKVVERTKLIQELNLLNTLADRYSYVEEKFGADPNEDFLPDDPDRTLNYMQPRGNPFVWTDLIPKELRPELSGTGLDGAVDPEVLKELYSKQYEANLRYVPIIIIGTMTTGPSAGCIYTFAGWGQTYYIEQGSSRCHWYGSPFSISAAQISEDFVVFNLRGSYDYGCRYAATGTVVRTFHIPR